ncbi:cytochrome c oxidase subunit 4 [Streptomyces albofaciens JCM 4342]|uniref:aa3-type cytochrome oxidase subunit IV n=1 Tax=Streptomyces albofaciens TaxID=66866 RepID=UPI00123965A3|nr:cytochrome c oxidase subunit 4 [Streptomyces albofaciens]KAA6212298.1 cytochrome c oxidase subunit 4 [Streptomyces albofaciens JCM 4342]
MRTEALLFAGVTLFFAVTGGVYGRYGDDPAGTAVLLVACLMAALVSFYLAVQYRKRGRRPQDRDDAEVIETAGPVAFFPAASSWPITVAAGSTGVGLGVVFGLWLALLGAGLLALGVFGLVFQYARHQEPEASPPDRSHG